MKFLFDLDGVITVQQLLPSIAEYFGVNDEAVKLAEEAVYGNIPFIESFIRSVHILGKLPVTDVANFLEQSTLHSKIYKFIADHKEDCIVVTCNLDCWVKKLTKKIGCKCYTSGARVNRNKVTAITQILIKEKIVKEYRCLGEKVTFIGSGNNDMEAMRIADIAIAAGLTYYPSNSIMSFADYLIFSEDALCRQLNQLS